MLALGIFVLEFEKDIVILELPPIGLIAKFCKKTKMPKFGSKNALFGYFWARILKRYCHI